MSLVDYLYRNKDYLGSVFLVYLGENNDPGQPAVSGGTITSGAHLFKKSSLGSMRLMKLFRDRYNFCLKVDPDPSTWKTIFHHGESKRVVDDWKKGLRNFEKSKEPEA